MQGCKIPEKPLFGEVCKNNTPLYGVFCVCVCFFAVCFFKSRPLVLAEVSKQARRCHLLSAPLQDAEQPQHPELRLMAGPAQGPLRTKAAKAQGRGEESSQGLALLLPSPLRLRNAN